MNEYNYIMFINQFGSIYRPIWKESVDEDFEDNVSEEMEGSIYSTPGV